MRLNAERQAKRAHAVLPETRAATTSAARRCRAGVPAVRQVVLSAWHFPPVQVPLQQPDELVQVAPSATQVVAVAQTWPVL